jgi:uncharacterized membrane protein YjdF
MFRFSFHNHLPLLLLLLFFPIWAYTGFKAYEKWVWLGESVLVLGFILFIAYQYRRKVLSITSYLLIFVFLLLTMIGVLYGFENVPFDQFTESLFGFRLGGLMGFERNHYDRFVHFSFGLLLYLPVYEIGSSAPGMKSRFWRHLIAFMAINASSAIYEIIEMLGSWLIDEGVYLAYLSHQGDVLDAPKDMAMALLGALLAMCLMLLRKHRQTAVIIMLIVIFFLSGQLLQFQQSLAGNWDIDHSSTTASCIAESTSSGTYEVTPSGTVTPTADEIIKRSLERYNDINLITEVTMKVVRPSWQSEVGFNLWALSDDYALVVITSPAQDRGQAFLKRKSDLWHWIPSIDRTIRMSEALLSQSWMGSDFALNDVLRNNSMADHYHATLNGKETIDDFTCHHITLLPHNDAPVVWGKVETWIEKDTYDQIRAIFYDDQGNMVQQMDARGYNSHNKRRMPEFITMTPLLRQGHHTIMHFTRYDLNKKLDEGFFSHQQMRRLY